ncbi:response regulator transcription factor [Streptomyces sp. NPDC006458]|uniref:response regulator transcription factor n=1 Tax=Streptomyces sp. NPDC006458 TaxID=3154302 RepID=UPI0033B3102E
MRAGQDGRLRVIVADDNPVVRAGLAALLSDREDITVVAQAADGGEACEAAARHAPDVVLLDVRMPGLDGLSALPHLVRLAPVLMLTYSRESETVQEALRRGAVGYLVHGEFTTDELVTAVRDVKRGRPHFTASAGAVVLAQLRGGATAMIDEQAPSNTRDIKPQNLSQLQAAVRQSTTSGPDRAGYRLSSREAEIMDLIASGMTNHQIAAACFISEKTVKNHINRIFAKLHSTTRGEAAAKWLGTAPGCPGGHS